MSLPPVRLLGLPTDCNSSHLRGAAAAPAAIRAFLASGGMNLTSESGADLGDPALFRDDGDLALKEAPSDRKRIAAAAADAFVAGPALFLGGDHFVTFPVLEGLVRATGVRPHVVHVDAHPDLYPDYEGNPYSHASPMARIMELGVAQSLTQIGIRTLNPEQQGYVDRFGVTVVTAADFERAFDVLPDGPVYLSLDLDGLDPAFAPGVSHPEPGGLSVREVLRIAAAIKGPVIGADIVEYNPARDIHDLTAAVAAKFVKEFAARMLADRT